MKVFFYVGVFFVFLNVSNSVRASVVAIVDTGVDVTHIDIAPSVWVNPLDLPDNMFDEDQNGYVDDINGWNFAENSGTLIDGRYLKYLTPELKRFFDIQSRIGDGNIGEEEIRWAREKLRNRRFMRRIAAYSSFMHGTHVGGIAVKGTSKTQLLAAKLSTAGSANLLKGQTGTATEPISEEMFWGRLRTDEALLAIVDLQMDSLNEIVSYLDGHHTDVANFSFGVTYQHAREIVAEMEGWSMLLGNRNRMDRTVKAFLRKLIEEGRKMAKKYPGILFVVAAGNEGTDNDKLWAFPANVNEDNTITVAATFEDGKLASFSNYGGKTVEIAAPGVAIHSTVPGNEYLSVSGTSQAAPLVTRVASMVKDSNPSLTPKQIKKILMQTVTKKSWLRGKIASGGVLNQERAVYAADLSNVMELDAAISHSLREIEDTFVAKSNWNPFAKELKDLVLPLPSMFLLER